MKNIAFTVCVLTVSVIMLLTLVGCGKREVQGDEAKKFFEDMDKPINEGKLRYLLYYRDSKTGCQYVGTNSGLYPRMDKDGKQVCE